MTWRGSAGIIAILYPAFLGYPQPHYPGYEGQAEGWYDEVVANGPEGCRAYGEYLGRRLGGYANVIWSIGADRNPEQARGGLEAIAAGIKSTAPGDLMTAQMLPEHSAAEHYPDADWLDVLSTYSYSIIPRLLERDWSSTPTRPFFLVETAYENEHNTSQLQLRRAAYWSVLGGGVGHVMGNKPIWMFDPGWKDEVESDGARGTHPVGEFFRSIDWSTLVPDHEKTLVSGGRGEERGLNQIGAARSQDGRLAVVYVPEQRPITIETGVARRAGGRLRRGSTRSAERRLPGGTLAVERTRGAHGPVPGGCRAAARGDRSAGEREVAAMAIMTVNGPIEPDQLGLTLAHEHIFCDTSGDFREPPAHIASLIADMGVDLEEPIHAPESRLLVARAAVVGEQPDPRKL